MNRTQELSKQLKVQYSLKTKVLAALLLGCAGITLTNIFTNQSANLLLDNGVSHFLGGLLFSGISVIGIWIIRKKMLPTARYIGLRNYKTAIKTFGFGIGLILVPLIITLLTSVIFGWTNVSVNTSRTFLFPFLLGFLGTFLTDALPEELIFRGFIYANLNTKYNKLISGATSVVLFAVFPIIIVGIQKYILGYDVFIGGTDRITPSFMMTMLFFGSFMQYLRVLTNSVWTTIGFHTLFVFMNQLIGIESHRLIQLSTSENELPAQIVLISLVVITFIGLLAYPRITKMSLNWKGIEKQ